MSKKVLILVAIIAVIAIIAGVILLMPKTENNKQDNKEGNAKIENTENIEGSLEEIMTKVYAGISNDNLPMMLMDIPVAAEDIEYYVGTNDIDCKEVLANESGVGSIAHSVVLVRLNDASKAEETVKKIKENVNPAKWICVEATNVIVKSKGDLVILIMSNETLAPMLEANFDGLK